MPDTPPAWRHAAAVAYHTLDDEAIVVQPRRREMSHLNEVAAFVWDRLRAGATEPDLATAIVDAYDVPPERAATDLRALLREMSAKGLIEPVAGRPDAG